jgi:hypothetical protein
MEDIVDNGGPNCDDADRDSMGDGTEKGEPASLRAVVNEGSVCLPSPGPTIVLGGDVVDMAARTFAGSARLASMVN